MKTAQLFIPRFLACLVAALAVLILAEESVSAEPPENNSSATAKAAKDSPRIAFVRLRFVGDEVQLVDFKVVPGRFKPTPEPAGERILVQVNGSSGRPVWEGWVNDPRIRVVEYKDPTREGRLAGKAVAVPNPEVMVRVPFVEEGQTLHFWRATPVKESAAHYKQLSSVQLREH